MIISLFLLIEFFFLFSILLSVSPNSSAYRKCTTLIYDSAGEELDVAAMLSNCTKNIGNSLFPPSYYKSRRVASSQFTPTYVNTSVSINNLIEVNDITSQITLDIYIRNYWIDPRINLPDEVWSEANSANLREGLEIAPYVRSSNSDPISLWLPDIRMVEVVSENPVAEAIRMFPGGKFFWSRHSLVTLMESQMDLLHYPNDEQTFTLTMQSFAYSTDFVEIVPLAGKFASLNKNPSYGKINIAFNALWDYDSTTVTTKNYESSIFFDPIRKFSTVTLFLTFQRQPFGIVYRLALPIMIFMIIVGYTFYADISQRIDISVNMLFVISAMYLVIGQIIPFVGYFTEIDLYITAAFVVLSTTILVHFLIYQLDKQSRMHPFTGFVRDFIVSLGRVLAVPLAAYLFLYFFGARDQFITIPILIMVLISFVPGLGNVIRLSTSFQQAYESSVKIEQGMVYMDPVMDEFFTVIEPVSEEVQARMKISTKLKLNRMEQVLVKFIREVYKEEELLLDLLPSYSRKVQNKASVAPHEEKVENSMKNAKTATILENDITKPVVETILEMDETQRKQGGQPDIQQEIISVKPSHSVTFDEKKGHNEVANDEKVDDDERVMRKPERP